jgi:hypothetical protein
MYFIIERGFLQVKLALLSRIFSFP